MEHAHFILGPALIFEHCYSVLYFIVAGRHYFLNCISPLHFEGHHNLMGDAIFVHLPEPVPGGGFVPGFSQRLECPFLLQVEGRGVVAPLQKDAAHGAEIMHKPIVVAGKNARAKGGLKHVPFEAHLHAGPEPAGTLKNLHIGFIAHHFNDLCHQGGITVLNEANFVLPNRAVHFHEDEVGDDTVDTAGGMLLRCRHESSIFCSISEMKLRTRSCPACGSRESHRCSIRSCNR